MQCFDVTSKAFTGQFDTTGGVGQLVGIKKHKKLISLLKIVFNQLVYYYHTFSTLITCTDKGTVTFWPEGTEKVSKFYKTQYGVGFFVGGNLYG